MTSRPHRSLRRSVPRCQAIPMSSPRLILLDVVAIATFGDSHATDFLPAGRLA
jgi:hypothetical protein